jgi:hypothetical protein
MMRLVKALALGFALILLAPRAGSAQECSYDFSVYGDYFYISADTVEVYGQGVDNSYCPGWGHFYDIRVYTSGSVTGLQESNDYYGYSDGTAHFHVTVTEYLDFGADFWVWCSGVGGWVGSTSFGSRIPVEPQVICPIPQNFHRISAPQQLSNGLRFSYDWDSSSGSLSDLSACQVGETNPYYSPPPPFPSPPFAANDYGATPWDPIPGDAGGFDDIHNTNLAFVKPYSATSVLDSQTYRFRCPCHNFNAWTTLYTPFGGINREFSQNGDGTWKFTLSKEGYQWLYTPLP